MFPWSRCLEVRWGEAEPDSIKVEIGGWLVVIYGHNLEAVCRAIEKQTLLRIQRCLFSRLSFNIPNKITDGALVRIAGDRVDSNCWLG